MYRIKKNLILSMRILTAVLLLIIVITKLWQGGVFLPRTAEVSANRVIWNGTEYSPADGGAYTEYKIIAKGMEGDWIINAVREDPSHTFIVARSFLDQYLMVSDDYTVPTEGLVTMVSWNGVSITDAAFINALSRINAEKTTSFTYQTDGITQLTEDQHMRALYIAYEGCPIATDFCGYLGKVSGEWVITTEIADNQRHADGSPKPYTVSVYRIPTEYSDLLENYFT